VRQDNDLLNDILESINKIEQHAGPSHPNWHLDELKQVWVIHHIQIIGEAVSRLSSTLKDSNSEIPWKLIVGMRNILIHAYFGVDFDRVRATVENSLPDLKAKVLQLLNP
jgi:uncharacterized protein with HEPN domain